MSVVETTLKKEIKELQDSLEKLKKARDEARERHDAAKRQINKIQGDIQAYEDALAKLQEPMAA